MPSSVCILQNSFWFLFFYHFYFIWYKFFNNILHLHITSHFKCCTEEDLKRLQMEANGSSYSQVEFQYGNEKAIPNVPNREECNDSPMTEESDQAFQLPHNFEVPANIPLPDSMKQHAIIEKTARFIASQGVQMEILLKAKQSNNLQFEFLSANSTLNAYYKFMINAIKEGKYPAESPPAPSPPPPVAATLQDSAATESIAPEKRIITVPSIKYIPSANCAYTQLISKIKGVPLPEILDESSNLSGLNSPSTSNNSDNFTPVLLQYNGANFVKAENIDETDSNSQSKETNIKPVIQSSPQVEVLKNTSALALAQNYSSGSEDEDEETENNTKEVTKTKPSTPSPPKFLSFPTPPEPLQNMIDKTAQYVVKNGRQFEETLRTKDVERFSFLTIDNEYYPYYMFKISGDPFAASKEQKTRKAAALAAAVLSKKGLLPKESSSSSPTEKEEKVVAPVSFSIKVKDDFSATNLPPALPQEPSDDEESTDVQKSNNSSAPRNVPENVQKAIKLVESQLMARNAQLSSLGVHTTTSVASNTNIEINNKSLSKSQQQLQENALYEQQKQIKHKEQKMADEKIKDKLALIAREKLGGLITKEKELQLERKRKAMAFLNTIGGPELETSAQQEELNKNSDSDASVHSIPITSYGPDDTSDNDVETSNNTQHLNDEKRKSIEKPTTTVTVSDDDDVELVGEIKPADVIRQKLSSKSGLRPKRRSHSPPKIKKKRHRRSVSTQSSSSTSSSNSSSTQSSSSSSSSSYSSESESEEDRRRYVKTPKYETKSSKSKKQLKSKSKKKPKSKKNYRVREIHGNSQSLYKKSKSKYKTETPPSSKQIRQHKSKRQHSSRSPSTESVDERSHRKHRKKSTRHYELIDEGHSRRKHKYELLEDDLSRRKHKYKLDADDYSRRKHKYELEEDGHSRHKHKYEQEVEGHSRNKHKYEQEEAAAHYKHKHRYEQDEDGHSRRKHKRHH